MTPRDGAVPQGFEPHPEADPERRPLFREIAPAPEFPLAALGALRPAADAICALTQAPAALCAQSVLAAVSLAACPHYDVLLPTGQPKPVALLCISVAASGERKSSVDALATAPIRAREAELAALDHEARRQFWADHGAWKIATEIVKRQASKQGRAAIKQALLEIGPEPNPPPLPMLLIADPTPEAIALTLADGRPFAGLFSDEGAALIGGHAFADESRMRTGALINSLWDGSPIRRLRVLSGHRYAPGRRLAGHLMMQEIVADRLLGDEMLANMGTLARLLVVAPDSSAGTRLWREPDPQARITLRDYNERVVALLRKTPRIGDAGALDPLPLSLSPKARQVMIAFHDAVERQLAPAGTLAAIRAFSAKGVEHACRLAATMSAFADPEAAEIGADDAADACVLVQHYAGELLRLGEGARLDPDLRLAARLLEWWQDRPHSSAHLAEIYQTGPYGVRTADKARQIVAILLEHGWVRRLGERNVIDGRRRRDAWVLT